MPKIIELEQHIADLIAAGEVVQRPSSVVKELIENSIDAGANLITVEICSGGMALIRVTDNGCGIAAEDVETAFLRHATSKLRDAEGLAAIGTLGFRGEALAAIAAVSRIELLTREYGAGEGVSLSLEAGETLEMSPAGCPEGTTIIVRDLFYNTPARLKFMKSDRAEGSSVASVVLRCALSRPDVSIRFIKDGKTEYHTPGDSRIDSCIYSLLGREIEAGFINAESYDEAVSVKGFVSSPAASRGNRNYQFFFINGRSIRSLLLQTALEQAYKNALLSGRFPSCVLYIKVKPGDVDVNVHPAKTEVKFVSEKQVFDSVYYAALGALEQLHKAGFGSRTEDLNKSMEEQEIISQFRTSDSVGSFGSKDGLYGNEDRKEGFKGGFKTMRADDFRKIHVAEPSKIYKSPVKTQLFSTQKAAETEQNNRAIINTDSLTDFHVSPFRVIGEVLNMYIIVEYESSIWFIDKHAAHERIHYDALRSSEYEPMSESLLMPVICRVGHEDASVLLENSDFIEKLGFTVESFGEDEVAVRHIPSEIDISDTESVLSDLCAKLRYSGAVEPEVRDSIFKTIACKAAIKAGSSSGSRELESLAAAVMSGELSHCPHGRPVAFEVTKSTLDKGFGRI